MPFTSFGLTKSLLNTLAEQKYTKPYPIQEKTIPAILKGKDVLGIAQTGSGKTASYVLPILNMLQGRVENKNRHIDVLVLAPTRELAIQIQEVFHVFSATLTDPVKSLAVYGGVSINPQMIALQNVNVLVATPGRLLELIESNAVSLSNITTLVIDEADKMLNMGFKEEMNRIFKLLPVIRQNLLFSATLNDDVKNINQFILNKPQVISIEAQEDYTSKINQLAYYLDEPKKGPMLRYLIKQGDLKQVLVFAASAYKADNIADKLRKNGIDASAVHSKKSQTARKSALKNFKAGKLRVLVSTDLLARGIDIEFLPVVINYELPRSPKDYIHRIGRTGRAEASGDAISLIAPDDEHHFRVIQKKMGRWVTRIDGNELNLKGY